ncbi:hypothetical protein EYF80_053815 [Liparis tanakae]|uniref:Uncharacterized protein n=1 Tax=Liparis tanakae TaxID=230148 RepID=A0A4Z2F4F5_9TELE|nr:hypothetical protein EYF80_053815 [Liparis tanakae]
MTVLYTVRPPARAREIPFPKRVREKHKYPTKQNSGRFWNPCRTHFLGLKNRKCPGKTGRLVTLTSLTSSLKGLFTRVFTNPLHAPPPPAATGPNSETKQDTQVYWSIHILNEVSNNF